MKKILAWLLLAAVLVSLCGCAGEQKGAETAAQTTAASDHLTQPEQETEAPTETEPQVLEGALYLKVSAVTFSLVGESEDIYLGMIPRELVTWESEDPEVVSVENGVLTANGVGTTTIRATYEDRQVSCTVGCLAQTQEDLEGLGFSVLTQPKHILPEVDLETPCTYFDNAAIVGDSITYMMLQCESKGDYLGDMLFLARGGTSLNGFVLRYKNIYYKGREMNLEDAIAESGVGRMYILIGSNDIATPSQRENFMNNWATMVERIREKSPEVEIVIISNIPQYADLSGCQAPNFLEYNSNVLTYNEKLRDFCREKNCFYFDLYYYIQDHCGRMPEVYNLDGYHLNDTGYKTWMQIMRYYAQYELEGGTLS